MSEHYYKHGNAYSFIRHSPLKPGRKTLLFLHGIGDSSISYLPFLKTPILSEFNIIIPDLLGYGKSSNNNDYHFNLQCNIIVEQLKSLEEQYRFKFEDIILVAHSMGGIHAMILFQLAIQDQIKGIINIEGSITQYGSFISETVFNMHGKGNFEQWFQKFKEIIIFQDFISKFSVCRSYYASLQFCHPQAFLQNALEMRRIALEGSGKYTNSAGHAFAKLSLPKIYCYGDQSLCNESLDFLHMNELSTQAFHSNNHFVMLDRFDEFVQFIKEWIILNI